MTVELKQHFVAFLDVLGFKEMVESDVRGDNDLYLKKLFKCHQSASHIFSDDPHCAITQFSDSIVISKPYDEAAFEGFIIGIAKYQRLLLDEELLCRGGIAINKHFSNGTFTFSAGLIAAYMVESKAARYPRVVISPEVMELLYPDTGKKLPPFLIQEDDGLIFIDYIGITTNIRPKSLRSSIEKVVHDLLKSKNASVREKVLWLASYSDACLGTSLSKPRFIGRKIR